MGMLGFGALGEELPLFLSRTRLLLSLLFIFQIVAHEEANDENGQEESDKSVHKLIEVFSRGSDPAHWSVNWPVAN